MTRPLRGAPGAQVAAQAKVNLRLCILAQEASGFHQLETLLLRLTLADTVRVRRTSGASTLRVTGEIDPRTLGPDDRNLAWRAAAAYLGAARLGGGVAIELEKRIPVGGGLGGGSADAGAVLRALDAVAPSPMGEEALLALAATLGADVPFLTTEHPYALAWGRGDRMLALTPPESRPIVLVVPPFTVNTATAYGWLAAARESGALPPLVPGLLAPRGLSDWEAIAALATNDFEAVVAARHPGIGRIVRAVRELGCPLSMMSGSGSVVLGVGPRAPAGLAFGLPEGFAEHEGCRGILTTSADRVEPVRPLD